MTNTRPDIIVVDTDAPIADSRYMATFGDYDLDCMTGFGHTPLNAIVDLLDREEAAAEAHQLIQVALSRCEGCRLHWRLTPGGGFHRFNGDMVACTALDTRNQLREIACKSREAEHARRT